MHHTARCGPLHLGLPSQDAVPLLLLRAQVHNDFHCCYCCYHVDQKVGDDDCHGGRHVVDDHCLCCCCCCCFCRCDGFPFHLFSLSQTRPSLPLALYFFLCASSDVNVDLLLYLWCTFGDDALNAAVDERKKCCCCFEWWRGALLKADGRTIIPNPTVVDSEEVPRQSSKSTQRSPTITTIITHNANIYSQVLTIVFYSIADCN